MKRDLGLWVGAFSLLIVVGCGPAAQAPREKNEKGVAEVAQAATAAASTDPACALLDNPSLRARMSGPFENKLLTRCGKVTLGKAAAPRLAPALSALAATPGEDIPVSDPTLDSGGTIQSETSMAAFGNIVCSAWNDSGEGFGANGFSGHGVSLDGGQTFADGGPFPSGPFDSNFGDPSLAYSVRDNTFYYAALSSAGLSLWRSTTDCQTFEYVSPIHSGFGDDKELIIVDNTPSSPFFGRIHIGWTDFSSFDDLNATAHSDDGGVTWSPPIHLLGSGSSSQGMWPATAPNGDVYMGVGKLGLEIGALQDQRIFKSTDGGNTWAKMTDIGTGQLRPEDPSASSACGRQALTGFIRYLSSPQIAIAASASAPAGYVIHAVYSYDSDGPGADHSNVFYRQSTDGAVTWSTETKLNDDETATDQFFPAIAVSDNGSVAASWYDRRLDPTSNIGFDRFLTFSTDGGLTWNPNERISDVTSPLAQTLPNPEGLAFCYHGDYDQMALVGNTAHVVWSDDRRVTSSGPNPDVYYDQFLINPSLGRITATPPTVSCSGSLTVSLSDQDLAGQGTHAVDVTTSRDDAESLVLTEEAGKPGTFVGSINTTAGPIVLGDGSLEVQDSDVITATYNDADDGHGQPAIATVHVSVDCVGPAVSNVRTTSIGHDSAVVTIDASEPAALRVDYGFACSALVKSATSTGVSQSPSTTLTGLFDGRTYFFAVVATDRAGNSTRDDNGGNCYSLKTLDILYKADFEHGAADFTFDNSSGVGNGLWHLSDACASQVLGHSVPHTLYYGKDSTCTTDNGFTHEGFAISPVIDLGTSSFASLEFNYFLGTEGGGFFDQASVDVSVNGGPFTIVASNFSHLEDEGVPYRTREGAVSSGGLRLVENTQAWQRVVIELTSLLTPGVPNSVQIRFHFSSIDFFFNGFAGYYVDDMTIFGVAPPKPCTADAGCDDGLFCTGQESCVGGFCVKGPPVLCADSDTVACTEDVCDETARGCVSKPNNARCDDGKFCNGFETCDPVNGCQPPSGPPTCNDDGVACTIDVCSEALKGCDHQPDNRACDDGKFCTGFEFCDVTLGCQTTGFPCNDGIACTNDFCDETTFCSFVPDDTKCNDGLFCTGVETCNQFLGCQTTGDPCPGPDRCDENIDQCVPICFTDTNGNHETAGRAFHKKKTYFAVGSNDALGAQNVVTSLQGSGAFFKKVDSCPVPPSIDTLTATIAGDLVTISGTASDANHDIAFVRVTFFVNGLPVAINATGTESFSASVALLPGFYQANAQAFDKTGLFSPEVSIFVFIFNPVPPSIDSITASPSGNSVLVSGTASDLNNDIAFVEITVVKNGVVVANTVATGTTTWSGMVTGLAPGSYVARGQAFDQAGLASALTLAPFDIAAPPPCKGKKCKPAATEVSSIELNMTPAE